MQLVAGLLRDTDRRRDGADGIDSGTDRSGELVNGGHGGVLSPGVVTPHTLRNRADTMEAPDHVRGFHSSVLAPANVVLAAVFEFESAEIELPFADAYE